MRCPVQVSCSCLVCDRREYPTVRDALAKIAELGFAAFDLDAFENWQHVSPSRLADDEANGADRLVETISASALTVSSFNCGMSRSLADPDADAFAQYKREFLALLDLASRVSCPNLTVQPGGPREGYDDDTLRELVATRLSELSRHASQRGITVGVEAHHGSLLERPEAAVELIGRLWPAVGLTYDPSHFVIQEIPLQDTEPLLDHTVHVHVRNAAPGKMQETMEDGVVDFAWLVGALEARGYDAALAIEYFNGFDVDFRNTRVLREELRALLR